MSETSSSTQKQLDTYEASKVIYDLRDVAHKPEYLAEEISRSDKSVFSGMNGNKELKGEFQSYVTAASPWLHEDAKKALKEAGFTYEVAIGSLDDFVDNHFSKIDESHRILSRAETPFIKVGGFSYGSEVQYSINDIKKLDNLTDSEIVYLCKNADKIEKQSRESLFSEAKTRFGKEGKSENKTLLDLVDGLEKDCKYRESALVLDNKSIAALSLVAGIFGGPLAAFAFVVIAMAAKLCENIKTYGFKEYFSRLFGDIKHSARTAVREIKRDFGNMYNDFNSLIGRFKNKEQPVTK